MKTLDFLKKTVGISPIAFNDQFTIALYDDDDYPRKATTSKNLNAFRRIESSATYNIDSEVELFGYTLQQAYQALYNELND